MSDYMVRNFSNGRFAFIPEAEFQEAIEAGKKILIILHSYNGGYALEVGADRYDNGYFGDEPGKVSWGLFSHSIEDRVLTGEEMAQYHKVYFTRGLQIHMKTGRPATVFRGGYLRDESTTYEEFKASCFFNGESREEFERLRSEVDFVGTASRITSEDDGLGKLKALSSYHILRGLKEWVE